MQLADAELMGVYTAMALIMDLPPPVFDSASFFSSGHGFSNRRL